MKRTIALLLCLLLLAGCAVPGPSENPVSEPAQEKPAEEEFLCRVLYDLNGMLVLIPWVDGEAKGDLYTFNPEGKPLTDENGSATDAAVRPGDLLSISYDGSTLAIWPGLLSNPSAVQIIGYEETMTPFYVQIFLELYEKDAGLNSDIERISLDLTEVHNLTDAEKTALRYVLWCETGVEVFAETEDDLRQAGILEKNHHYPNGILMSAQDSPVENDRFALSVLKWRSPLGAVGYSDAKVEKTDSDWVCVPEAWFIS